MGNTSALNGRVAVMTGGQGGIGKEITAQLLVHGIEKVIIIARSEDKYITAREEWKHRAGISLENDTRTDVQNEYKHSPQNIERVFATNCVGHQVLATALLPLLKNGVMHGNDVRIVVTSSSFHFWCQQLDMDLLFSSSRVKWPALYDGIWRYGRSKLGNILFAKELSRRLLDDQDPASKQIYVNSFFPGNIVTEQWLAWNFSFGSFLGWLIRTIGSRLGQSVRDGAATALYLAASSEVRERKHRGQYFIPIATLCKPSAISEDMKLARDLWDWIDVQATESLGLDWQYR
ncbi:hypothetical protein PENVUL_c034G04000 [Penicillium vulpinum]|uniref:Polysaccharide biosynthesis protein CapD-like domain-containing protein n=1 Tax=Penicillium vulpinum TaxID=29845 RepID=A0A1V6RRE8_9EURO|nr:hypothetical protein PENVUL_c034G04000 [Penicillium vulpinum]